MYNKYNIIYNYVNFKTKRSLITMGLGFRLIRAILHPKQKTAEEFKEEYPDMSDEEIAYAIKINEMLDGQEAIVSPHGENYDLIGLVDPVLNKEVSYQLEQDPECGSYINNRDQFNKDYDSKNYSADFFHYFEKNEVEELKTSPSEIKENKNEQNEANKLQG